MRLFGDHLDRKKTARSLLLGLAGFVGVFYSFSVPYPPHTISFIWSLFLPLLAVLAYGRRAAVIVVTFGGMGFFPFFLWPTNGWANLVNVFIYGSWYIIHGYAADLRRTRPAYWNNIYSVQVLCSAVYTVLLVTIFPLLFTINPTFWSAAAPAFLPAAVAQSIAVKQALLMFGALFLCDLLLNVRVVPRLLGLPVPSSARFTPRVTVASILISLLVVIADQVLEISFTQQDLDQAVKHAVDAEHRRMVFLIALLSTAAGLQLAKYLGRRHDAEEAHRVSQERFSAIFDSVNDAIIIHDADTGAILDVNQAMTGMFGYPREEACGMTMEALSSGDPPYTQRDAVAWITRASSGKPQLFEWRYRHKDSRLFWGEVNMRRAAIGGLNSVLVVVRDITQRKLVEQKLHESERLYRMLFDTAGDAIFLMQGSRFVDCNNKALEMFGCSWEQILGETPARFSPPVQPDGRDSGEKALEKIAAAISGEPQTFEWKHSRADGTLFDAEVSLNRVDLSYGVRLQIIVRDISERKQAEEERERLIADIRHALGAVSRSQKEWQDTFDSITDLISIHDRNFTIVRVNKAFAEHVGLPYQQVIGRKCYELFHAAAAPLHDCPHARTLADGKPATGEDVDPVSGKTLRIATYPYYAPDGSLLGSIHIARDITEDKEREMKMIMTERLASLGQMASGIAHEINNPLESVMISAEMLLLRVAKDNYDHAQFEKYLKIIDEEVLRCRDITSNMLSFSRQTTLSKSDLDAHLLLDKSIDLVGYQGRLKNVTVTKKYGERLLVSGNEGELRQVFLVLLINALDAMENKGAITIGTGTQAGSAWVTISDTGPGIAPEHLQKIFHPFFSTKTERGGTGLGLSIAHRIIANHGGSLTVFSEQGRGAAFTITLPL